MPKNTSSSAAADLDDEAANLIGGSARGGDGRKLSPKDNQTQNSGTLAAGQLRALIERIERLEEEKKTIATDIREVYAEAKANGFDAKVMREVVRRRRQDATERQEYEAILDLYMHALGMAA